MNHGTVNNCHRGEKDEEEESMSACVRPPSGLLWAVTHTHKAWERIQCHYAAAVKVSFAEEESLM